MDLITIERVGLEEIDERDAVLDGILRCWHDRAPGDVPGLLQEVAKTLGGFLHIVDVTSGVPEQYRYALFGAAVTLYNNADLTGTRVIDAPWRALSERAVADYHECATSRAPLLHQVRLTHGATRSWDGSYARLLLPVGDAKGIRRVLVAIHPHRPTIRAARHPKVIAPRR